MKKLGFARKLLAMVLMTVLLMGTAVIPMNVGYAFSFPWNSNSNAAEEYAAEDEYDYWIDCSSCKTTGYCKYCDGTGRKSNGRMCTNCDGSGACSRCGGVGLRKLLLINGREYVVCGSCLGSTLCSLCDGSGRSAGGTILGSSYGTTCYLCKGRGSCQTCKGKGYTGW